MTTLFGPGAPQMGNDINVMTIPIYMMQPLTYRIFNDHETMVCSQTMWDGDIHYIKWYELRKEGAGWYIYQTGNYAPGDAHYFLPSISINAFGDIALGYSVCNEEMYPSIGFTGRRAEDSLGIMTFQEIELYKGLNYANTFQADYGQNRWGDYSSMMVDPSDDSTFWYTNMYTKATTALGNWATRIFSLNLSEDTTWPYAFAGNDTLAYPVTFFETDGEAENYSSILWTTSGDGNFMTNYAEDVTYLRGPEDLENGFVILSMHVTGYYPGTEAADSMILYLTPGVGTGDPYSDDFSLNLYPNPSSKFVTLKAKVLTPEVLIVQITDPEGKTIFTGRYSQAGSLFEIHFDVSYLPAGIYFVRMISGDVTGTRRLLVEK
jgi:hypothetical protein